MSYKIGDIILVKFPFTNLTNFKKRPVVVIKDENNLGDIVCFQITSKSTQSNLLKIQTNDISKGKLVLKSYIKYDKCFTISSEVVDKKIAEIDINILAKLKSLFCKVIF
jgi:mRNA interferase MazF